MVYNYLMMKKYGTVFSIIVFSLFAVHCFYDDQAFSAQTQDFYSARVAKVHDGDTVSVMIGTKKEKVRLIGIDAPELAQRPWGTEAKKHLEKILGLSGWKVELEFDVEKRDKYGRLLAYLWTTDKRLINLEILKDGYAVLFTFPPNIKHVDELRKGERLAREKDIGIWGKAGLKEMPIEYKKRHPR